MASFEEPLSSRLPVHEEHYRRIEEAYDAVFGEVDREMAPHIERYTEAGLPFPLIRGAVFRFEVDRGKGKGKLTISPGLSLHADQIESYHLSYDTTEDGEEVRVGSMLFPGLKEFNPMQFEKYHGQEYIDNAHTIVEELREPDTCLMGVELMPIRPDVASLLDTYRIKK